MLCLCGPMGPGLESLTVVRLLHGRYLIWAL
jgi:hypothetical protein